MKIRDFELKDQTVLENSRFYGTGLKKNFAIMNVIIKNLKRLPRM